MANNVTRRAFVANSAVAIAGASLALSGCAAQSPNSNTSSSATTSTPEQSSNASSPTKSKTLTAANAFSSTNYSPIDMCGCSTLMVAASNHVFEGLYDLDLTTYETYDALAAGSPVKVSETEYEVTLRDTAKFSDGSDVTIDDVVNAFVKNLATPTVGSLLSFIDSVAKKDEKTVAIKLKHPFASMLEARLALVKVFPQSQEDQLKTLPVGSGPWMYVEGKLNGNDMGTIEFVPNPNYTGNKPAKADAMRWSVFESDAVARASLLEEGNVMVAEDIPYETVDQLVAAGATVDFVQGLSFPFLMFNTMKEPLSDPRVRQAFFYAINPGKLISGRMENHATTAGCFLNRNHPNYHKASTVFTYNPDKAKELLADAGVPDGFSIKLEVNNNWVSSLVSQIASDLHAVGIETELEIKKLDWSEYAPTVVAYGRPATEPHDDGVPEFDVVLASGDPSFLGNDVDLLLSWWFSDNAWTQGRTFWKYAPNSRFEEMQTLLQQARATDNDVEQQAIWNQCLDLIAEEVPLYPLFHRQIATGYRADLIEGFKAIGTNGLVFLDASPR